MVINDFIVVVSISVFGCIVWVSWLLVNVFSVVLSGIVVYSRLICLVDIC